MTDLIESAANAIVGNPIPPALQKGFMKAVGRLLGAAVDVPAAKLEGYADEIRAASEARRSLVIDAGKSLSDTFAKDAPIVKRAQARMVSKILREQVAVEDIVGRSAEILSEASVDKEPDEVNEDWWNAFESEALTKSADDTKEIFSQILAGEIMSPSAFSIKAIKTISTLDRDIASSFNMLCSVALKTPHIAKVLALGGDANTNGLKDYGLNFSVLNRLQEYGLLHVDYNASMNYGPLAGYSGVFVYNNREALLSKIEGHGSVDEELKLTGVTLSKVGQELSKIARITPSAEYSKKLSAFLEAKGYNLFFYESDLISRIYVEAETPAT